MGVDMVVAASSMRLVEADVMLDPVNDAAGAGAGGRAVATAGAMAGAGMAGVGAGLTGYHLGLTIAGAGIATASSGASASRVICTHLYQKGMLDREVWRADMAFTATNLSPKTVRGYQFWAIPYVRLMRVSPFAERVIRPLAVWRAEELAFKMGVLPKSNWRGKIVRAIGEPMCYVIGCFAGEQNWAALWVTPHDADV